MDTIAYVWFGLFLATLFIGNEYKKSAKESREELTSFRNRYDKDIKYYEQRIADLKEEVNSLRKIIHEYERDEK